MIYKALGQTGKSVSAIGLGTWNLGNQWGWMSDAEAEEIIQAALDRGITLFDTAENYGSPAGTSEMRLGRALRGKRDSVTIVSKIGYWGFHTGQRVPKNTKDMIRLCGHAILGRLQTDYVDVILCHEGDIPDPSTYIAGFDALREEGCLNHYGISTDDLTVLKKFNDLSGGKCSVVELDYSLIDKRPEGDMLDYCREHGIAVLCRRPMASGILSGAYTRDTRFTDEVRRHWNVGGSRREQYEEMMDRLDRVVSLVGNGPGLREAALGYVISHDVNPVAIPGATSIKQVDENAKAGERLLPDGLYQKLTRV